jgi:hypothetical protein
LAAKIFAPKDGFYELKEEFFEIIEKFFQIFISFARNSQDISLFLLEKPRKRRHNGGGEAVALTFENMSQ